MTANLQEIPGIEYNFCQPIRDNVAENISGQFGQIAVKIYGDDLEQAAGRSPRRPRTSIAEVAGRGRPRHRQERRDRRRSR